MTSREEVTVTRDVKAVIIPAGNEILIPEGITVVITQTLGGSFTVITPHGYLARISGEDADALGKDPVEEKPAAETDGERDNVLIDAKAVEAEVWEQLRMVYDPEIPINIVDLGLIYECELVPEEKGIRVKLKMTMTAPGCGMGDVLKADSEERVLGIRGVVGAEAEIVWDPPWDQSRMSDAARLELGFG